MYNVPILVCIHSPASGAEAQWSVINTTMPSAGDVPSSMSTGISEICGDAISLSQPPPEWSVVGFQFSTRNTDSELTVMCNGKRFVLCLAADNLSESPKLKERYLFFLRVAEEFELDGFTVEDLWDWAAEPLFPLFRDMPPPDKTHQSTLDDFFNPETFVYTLRAVSDNLVPEKCENQNQDSMFGILLPDELCTPWTSVKPSEIRVCEEKAIGPPNHTPRKVLLEDDTVAFLKLMHRGDKQFLKTELDAYYKIDKARLDSTTRVSRLHGLVRDDRGAILGLLLTYIDCKNLTLSCAVKPETPTALREKWAAQLRDIITQLHNAGLVWGDAKPDNVLIDSNKDAWIVDFGGGYTEGWVPKTLAGTVEGDTVAFEKMVEFIST
ncbi:Protein kinase domain-containing protein [Fusarium keratoplasticum]|uniref:Protein kinase domain-containing protein n=1 Tax=Fusarium keratoplasticum TaxID=1328300 RepID=A0ACC0R654_9HYPO|nr:Protein kinase domain-containing protein [Fusarium keratoplasticum]KAI8675599.1 Protein kinase domain-containing protein [Fusarium keratoplasticum]